MIRDQKALEDLTFSILIVAENLGIAGLKPFWHFFAKSESAPFPMRIIHIRNCQERQARDFASFFC